MGAGRWEQDHVTAVPENFASANSPEFCTKVRVGGGIRDLSGAVVAFTNRNELWDYEDWSQSSSPPEN
jgi:hypothetical protein